MRLLVTTFRGLANPIAVLLPADFLVAFTSLWIGAWLRFDLNLNVAAHEIGPIAPRAASYAFWVMVALVATGMYRVRQRPTFWELVARVIVAVLLGGLCDVLFFYLVPSLNTGRGTLALGMSITAVLLCLSRQLLLVFFDHNPAKRRVLVIGSGNAASRLAMLRRRSDRRRFEIVGYLPGDRNERLLGAQAGLAPLLATEADLSDLVFDEVVVALDERRGCLPLNHLLRHRSEGIPVRDIVEFLEQETGRLDLDLMGPAWLIFSPSGHASLSYRMIKRLFDVSASAVFLVLVGPLLLLVALAIWAEDGLGAPVFYRQRRVGRGGCVFEVLKFRSMRPDAEKDTGPRWSRDGDDRVTRVGRLIRRFRIDELPQFLNVLRGDMSVVGPRPERPEFVAELAAKVPLYDYRHCMRPGLTGWAQLNFCYGASFEDAREKLKFDLFYIKNAGLMLDLLILLQTLEVVIWGRSITMTGRVDGARSGTDEPAPRRRVKLMPVTKRDVA